MAQVPTIDAPSINPSPVPVPRQNISAPADAFGPSVVGAGLEQVGQALGKSAEEMNAYAVQYQTINNKVAADNASIAFQTALDQQHSAYTDANKSSMSAVDNLPDLYKNTEDLRASAGADLSPMAKVEYDSSTRRYVSAAQNQLTNWASAQRNDAINRTANTTVDLASSKMAASPDDPQVQDWGRSQIVSTAVTLGTQNHWSPDDAKAYLQSKLGQVYTGQIGVAVDQGNISKAEQLLNDHSDDMTQQQIDHVNAALKVGAVAFTANGEAQAALSGRQFVDPRSTQPSTVKAAILGQESGDNAGVKPSVDGAIGPGQVTPDTFAQFAKPGEDINNPADNRRVSARIVDHYMTQYNGDAARTAVAYFSGPGNVAPAGAAQPYLHNYTDSNGKSVASYVSDVNARVGATAAQVPTPNLQLPSGPTDVNSYVANSDQTIQKYVEAKYGSTNPRVATDVASAMHAGVMRNAQQLTASQNVTYDTIGQAILANGIQSMPDLVAAVPGGASAISNLPPNLQLRIDSDLKHNANDFTAPRVSNIEALRGLQETDPAKFIASDLKQVDLPLSTRLELMKTQATMAKQGIKPVNMNSIVNSALSSINGQQALASLNLDPKTDKSDPRYLQFAGALAAEVDKFPPGKPPSQKDMNDIISRVTAKTGATSGGLFGFGANPGQPAFTVPDSERAAILAAFPNRNLNDRDISEIYYRKVGH